MVKNLDNVFKVLLLVACALSLVGIIKGLFCGDLSQTGDIIEMLGSGGGCFGSFHLYMRWHVVKKVYSEPEKYSESIKEKVVDAIPKT